MWSLQTDTDNKRVYVNSTTGSRCEQELIKIDKDGNKWWSFMDLLSLPFTRNFAASKVTSLYQLGLTKDDLTAHISGLKNILNSDDKEKYQKAYANILEFESKAVAATDPVKQMTSLTCVYYTINDELIDSFAGEVQLKKLSILESQPDLHSFFLQRQINLIERSQAFFAAHSQTASLPTGLTDTN